MAAEWLVSGVNAFLANITVAGQIIILGLLLLLFVFRNQGDAWIQYIKKHALIFAFIVALSAALGSLFWSEIAGYTPCKLCWFQRIFMYPQVIILGIALLTKDKKIWRYGIPLSIIGGLIAAYHYLMQIGLTPATSCSVVGYSVSCAETFSMHYGYITNPMMATTAFVLIIIFLSLLKKKHRSSY